MFRFNNINNKDGAVRRSCYHGQAAEQLGGHAAWQLGGRTAKRPGS